MFGWDHPNCLDNTFMFQHMKGKYVGLYKIFLCWAWHKSKKTGYDFKIRVKLIQQTMSVQKVRAKQILLSWISMVLHHKHYLMILVSSVIHYWYWFPIQGWFRANFSVFENSIFSSGPEQWHQLLWEMKPEGWRQLPCFA